MCLMISEVGDTVLAVAVEFRSAGYAKVTNTSTRLILITKKINFS